jgi:hypothetical protein
MKIQMKFPDKIKIGIVSEIPEGSALKLIGLNGVGKTMCAKLLSTIAGYPVWEKPDQIEKLMKYLPDFKVFFYFNDSTKPTFTLYCDVTKWVYLKDKRIIEEQSVGIVENQDGVTTISELRKHFRCYLIKGNEDIKKQINFICDSFISQVYHYLELKNQDLLEYQDYNNRLHNYLKAGDVFDRLIIKLNELNFETEKEKILTEEDTTYLASLLTHLENDKIDRAQLLTSYNNFKKNINEEHNILKNRWTEYDGKISIAKQKILTSQNLNNIFLKKRKQLEKTKNEIDSLSPPLKITEYPDGPTINKRMDDIIKERRNMIENQIKVLSHRFRKDVILKIEHSIDSGFSSYDKLDKNVTLLFASENGMRETITVDEFERWLHETIKIGDKELSDSPILAEIEEHLNKFIIEEEKLLAQKLFILKRDKLLLRLKEDQEALNVLGNLEDDDTFSSLIEKYNDTQTLLSHYQLLIDKLKSTPATVINYFNKYAKNQNCTFNDFIEKVNDSKNLYINIKRIRTDYQLLEKEYSNWLLTKLPHELENDIPEKVLKAIKHKNYKFLKMVDEILYTTMDRHRINNVKDELRKTSDYITENNKPDVENAQLTDFCQKLNYAIGEKLKILLNKPPFTKWMFDGAKIDNVDAWNDTLTIKLDGKEYSRYITDYSSGQKAFAFAFATILNLYDMSKKNNYSNEILFLDEFGALLSLDRMNFLLDELNTYQKNNKWPDKYILIYPYKGDFNILAEDGKKNKMEIDKNGYTYVAIGGSKA